MRSFARFMAEKHPELPDISPALVFSAAKRRRVYVGYTHEDDLYATHPDTVPTGRPRTQRTLACAGALLDGRVRQYFLAKRHLFVGAGHHAFPWHILLHHCAEHGTAKGYVQG